MKRNFRAARNNAGLVLLLAGSWLPAQAAFGETLTVDDIEVKADPGFTFTIPSIELTDSSLTEAQVRSLFSGDIAGNADALAKLDAANITIPEIVIDYDIPAASSADESSEDSDAAAAESDGDSEAAEPSKGEIHYKDIMLDDVRGGVAASVSFGSIDMNSDASGSGHFGKMSMANLDIGGVLGFYGLVASGAGTEMKTLYSDFNFEGGTFSDDEVSCDIGSMQLQEVKARPLKHSLLEIMQLAETMGPDETPDPATMGKMSAFYADLLTAFETTPMTFDGFDCSGETEEDGTISVKLGKLDIDGFKPGVYPAITANDVSIEAEDGHVTLDNFVLKPMDLTETMQVLASAPAEVDDAWFEANARKLIPAFGGFSFGGLDGDVPDEENAGERIKFKVADFDLTLADYVNGIPSNISTEADGIAADLPQNDPDSPFNDLIAAGVTSINAGYGLKAHWDQAAKVIEVENFTLHGDKLGTFALSGTIGNATPELFSNDLGAAQMAATGLTVKSVTTHVEDLGLGALMLARAGQEQGKTADEMRSMVSGIAQGSALALLGANEGSQALSQALNAFLMGTSQAITVKLTATDPGGLGLAGLMALQADPTALASKVKIESAEAGDAMAPATSSGQ